MEELHQFLHELMTLKSYGDTIEHKLNSIFTNKDQFSMVLNIMLMKETEIVLKQFIAILIKSRLSKGTNWNALSEDDKENIKHILIMAYATEKEAVVKRSFAQIIGVIAKHDLSVGNWPHLEKFALEYYGRGDGDKEMIMELLEVVADISHFSFKLSIKTLMPIFVDALDTYMEKPNSDLPYKAVKILNALLDRTNNNPILNNLVMEKQNIIMSMIKHLSTIEEDKSIHLLDMIENMIETLDMNESTNYSLFQLLHETAINNLVFAPVRAKAMYLIGLFVSLNPYLSRQRNEQHLNTLLCTLYQFMSLKLDDNDDAVYVDETDNDLSLVVVSYHVLGNIAGRCHSKKILPKLMSLMSLSTLKTNDDDYVYTRKANYLTSSVLVEHYHEKIKQEYMDHFINILTTAMGDRHDVVKKSASLLLTHCATFLQPNIAEYAHQIMPGVITMLNEISLSQTMFLKDEEVIEKSLQAIQAFFHCLDEESSDISSGIDVLKTYLNVLMENIIRMIKVDCSATIKTELLQILISIISTCREAILPYIEAVLQLIFENLTKNYTNETMSLLVTSLLTLSELWRRLKVDNLVAIFDDTMILIKSMRTDEPEVTGALYTLFGSVSLTCKEQIVPFLPEIMSLVENSIMRRDDTEFRNINKSHSSENMNNESEDSDILDIENLFMNEKVDAMNLIVDLVNSIGEPLTPYVDRLIMEIYKFILSDNESLQETAMECFVSMMKHKLRNIEEPVLNDEIVQTINMFITKMLEYIKKHSERTIAEVAAESLYLLIEGLLPEQTDFRDIVVDSKLPRVQLVVPHLEKICIVIKMVFDRKVECMVFPFAKSEPLDEESDVYPESDEGVIQKAGELLPLIGRILPGSEFYDIFMQFISYFVKYVNGDSSEMLAYSIGILAESIPPLSIDKEKMSTLLPVIYNSLFLNLSNDCADVRCNSIYGIGVLCYRCFDLLTDEQFQEVLMMLTLLFTAADQGPTIKDNIIASIARILIAKPHIMPVDDAVSQMLTWLPMHRHKQENHVVFYLFQMLYGLGNNAVAEYLTKIVYVASKILVNEEHTTKEGKELLCRFLKQIQGDFNNKFLEAYNSLPQTEQSKLHGIMINN